MSINKPLFDSIYDECCKIIQFSQDKLLLQKKINWIIVINNFSKQKTVNYKSFIVLFMNLEHIIFFATTI